MNDTVLTRPELAAPAASPPTASPPNASPLAALARRVVPGRLRGLAQGTLLIEEGGRAASAPMAR